WLIHHSQNRIPIDHKSDLNGEFPAMRNELSRSIHGINHPNMRRVEPSQIVRRFLRKDRVIWKMAGEGRPYPLTGLAVSCRNRIARRLPVHRELSLVIVHEDRTGIERQFFGYSEFFFHSGAGRTQYDTAHPSKRREVPPGRFSSTAELRGRSSFRSCF